MNIGLFFDAYAPVYYMKDPAQIVLGLNDLGIAAEMITLQKDSLNGNNSLPLKQISRTQSRDPNFWRTTNHEVVIAYTWLRKEYYWITETIKKGGKRLILKADTDGRYNFPLYPRWDCYLWNNLNLLSFLKILRRRSKRRLNGRKIAAFLCSHLETADCAIVESPQALSNISYILQYWDLSHLIGKLNVVPNPVSGLVCELPLRGKENQIVSIGNWDVKFGDYYVKNTNIMCNVLSRFLADNHNYKAVIIGDGNDAIKRFFGRTAARVSERVRITGQIAHEEVINYLNSSQVLFLPSISESFPISAGEALCMGCSVVGSPLESLQHLTQGGFSGTLAADFVEDAYLAALSVDALKWRQGHYSTASISTFWRGQLNRKRVATEIVAVINRLV